MRKKKNDLAVKLLAMIGIYFMATTTWHNFTEKYKEIGRQEVIQQRTERTRSLADAQIRDFKMQAIEDAKLGTASLVAKRIVRWING